MSKLKKLKQKIKIKRTKGKLLFMGNSKLFPELEMAYNTGKKFWDIKPIINKTNKPIKIITNQNK